MREFGVVELLILAAVVIVVGLILVAFVNCLERVGLKALAEEVSSVDPYCLP